MPYVIEKVGSPVLIIGQAPAQYDDPCHPITGRTGRRLASLMGMTITDFKSRFDRANLLDEWPGKHGKGDAFPCSAHVEAGMMLVSRVHWDYRKIVMLGRNVAKAFSHKQDWFVWELHDADWVAIPHPSGVNRWWNESGNVERARQFLVSLKGEV